MLTSSAASRFIFENYSREWFGLGILEYEGGQYAADIIYSIQDTFAIVGSKDKNHEPQEKAKAILVPYFEAAIAAVSFPLMLGPHPVVCDCLSLPLSPHRLLVSRWPTFSKHLDPRFLPHITDARGTLAALKRFPDLQYHFKGANPSRFHSHVTDADLLSDFKAVKAAAGYCE